MQIFCARYVLPVTSPAIEDGALLVYRGRLAEVGRRKEIVAAHPEVEQVDFGDVVLLPPLVNAHTHLELTHFPIWAAEAGEEQEPESFVEWIRRVIRVKRGLDAERYLSSAREGIGHSLASGTGAVGDVLSFFPARAAFAQSPLKGRLFFETLGWEPARNREALASLEAVLEEGRVGNLEPGIAPHSPYTLSPDYLEEVFAFARRRQVCVSTHIAESSEESRFLRDSEGPLAYDLFPRVGWGDRLPAPIRQTPVAYVAERGGLTSCNLLAHGVHVVAEDVEKLAQAGLTVVLCPRSNARLGVGKAPVGDFLKAGVPLALGTDSMASNDSLSVWDELAFAESRFGSEVGPHELLRMATHQGAKALGLGGEMGALQTGFGAHFQVLSPAALPPLSEVEAFLCSAGRTEEVTHLYLDGWDALPKA